MSDLGVSKFEDLIGRSDLMNKRDAIEHWKAKDIDFSKILWKPETKSPKENFNSSKQIHDVDKALDIKIIKEANDVIFGKKASIQINKTIRNIDRSFGAMLSGEIARKFGFEGLNEDSIVINLKGTAGQSFGTFLAKGVTLNLIGEGNDYVGKGLSGGRIIVSPNHKKIIDQIKTLLWVIQSYMELFLVNVIFQVLLEKGLQLEILGLLLLSKELEIIVANI